MSRPYTRFRHKIESAISTKDFKLAQKFLKQLEMYAEAKRNPYGKKAFIKMRRIVKNEYFYYRAEKAFKLAKAEFERKYFSDARILFLKAKKYAEKTELVKKQEKQERFNEIESYLKKMNIEKKKFALFYSFRDYH